MNGNCSCPSGINDVKQPIRCQAGKNLKMKIFSIYQISEKESDFELIMYFSVF